MFKILLDRLEKLANVNGNAYIDYADIVEVAKEVEKEYNDIPIDELDLTLRPLNILKRGGVKTIQQLCNITESELMKFKGMGKHSMEEIQNALNEYNLYLRGIEQLNTNESFSFWTSIKDGLPPVGEPLIVTIKDNLQSGRKELRYPVYYEKDSMKSGYHWSWRYGDFSYELLPEVSEVIAWAKLPQIYDDGSDS